MKKKIKIILVCVILALSFSSCGLFGERKSCPAYSEIKAVDNKNAEQS